MKSFIEKGKRRFFQNRRLLSNFSYLTFVNVVNKALPLFIVPYIVRVIGVEKFGVISFAWAVSAFFILVTRYSFELTAVKFFSEHRENKSRLDFHYWSVFWTRLVLACMMLVVLSVSVLISERIAAEYIVMYLAFGLVIADVLMPTFLFYGTEEMKYLAIFNFFAKVVYGITVFFFVKTQHDYAMVAFANSFSLILLSAYAFWFAKKRYGLSFQGPNIASIKALLKEGKDIFVSNMYVSFYTMINPILLGVISGYKAVGIYSLAEAIYGAYSLIVKTYTTVIYPHLSRVNQNKTELARRARKFLVFYLVVLIVASIVLFMLAEFIITLLYGSGHEESVYILKILALALLLEPLGGFFTRYLALKGEYKTLRAITFKTMAVNLLTVAPFLLFFDAIGVAYLFLFLSIVQVALNFANNKELILTQKSDYEKD